MIRRYVLINAQEAEYSEPASSAPYTKLFMSGRVGYSPAFSMRSTPRTLIFLHIPKTGGTTFRNILERNYSRDEVLTFRDRDFFADVERFARSDETERSRYRLIQGHLYFCFHHLVPGDSTYMTWMRDPIARAQSFYSHARTRPDHYLHRQVMEEQLDLKALLKRHSTPELFNLQTRMIAGVRNLAQAVDRSALENAKKNLEANFYFVGITNEFDAGLVLLSEMLGWKPPFYRRSNVTRQTRGSALLDPETDRLLREANALDLELYQFAKELFEARRLAAGPAFESKVNQFQQLNAVGAAQRHYGKIKAAVKNATTLRAGKPAALKESRAEPSI